VNGVEANLERANHDLDFVAQQQQELTEIIEQMETALGVDDWSIGTAIGSMAATHSDLQREMMSVVFICFSFIFLENNLRKYAAF
jgi:hypothetical protein